MLFMYYFLKMSGLLGMPHLPPPVSQIFDKAHSQPSLGCNMPLAWRQLGQVPALGGERGTLHPRQAHCRARLTLE